MIIIRVVFFLVGMLIFTQSMAQERIPSSSAKFYTLRLKPHQDLKKELIAFAVNNNLKAACIVTCVGSLEQFHLRFANEEKGALRNGHFEIVSLTGTFSASSSHLHLAVSDSTGTTIGGHVLEGNLIYTTGEIVIVEMTDLEFSRIVDDTYGFMELAVKKRKRKTSSGN